MIWEIGHFPWADDFLLKVGDISWKCLLFCSFQFCSCAWALNVSVIVCMYAYIYIYIYIYAGLPRWLMLKVTQFKKFVSGYWTDTMMWNFIEGELWDYAEQCYTFLKWGLPKNWTFIYIYIYIYIYVKPYSSFTAFMIVILYQQSMLHSL